MFFLVTRKIFLVTLFFYFYFIPNVLLYFFIYLFLFYSMVYPLFFLVTFGLEEKMVLNKTNEKVIYPKDAKNQKKLF